MDREKLSLLQQLNIELLDTLELCLYSTKAFCEKNNIPFYDEKVLALIKKAECLIDEINPFPYAHTSNLADGFLQRKRTDDNLTEPF